MNHLRLDLVNAGSDEGMKEVPGRLQSGVLYGGDELSGAVGTAEAFPSTTEEVLAEQSPEMLSKLKKWLDRNNVKTTTCEYGAHPCFCRLIPLVATASSTLSTG